MDRVDFVDRVDLVEGRARIANSQGEQYFEFSREAGRRCDCGLEWGWRSGGNDGAPGFADAGKAAAEEWGKPVGG